MCGSTSGGSAICWCGITAAPCITAMPLHRMHGGLCINPPRRVSRSFRLFVIVHPASPKRNQVQLPHRRGAETQRNRRERHCWYCSLRQFFAPLRLCGEAFDVKGYALSLLPRWCPTMQKRLQCRADKITCGRGDAVFPSQCPDAPTQPRQLQAIARYQINSHGRHHHRR